MPKSAVAGIVDPLGGIRVVVTELMRMPHHVGPGERLFVLPNVRVQEPVAWGSVPSLINRVVSHVQNTLKHEQK